MIDALQTPDKGVATEPACVCKLLPFDGRMALVRASKTPGDGLARMIAIELAESQVKRNFPTFFHQVIITDENSPLNSGGIQREINQQAPRPARHHSYE
jgi:hypothetical protein